MGSVTQLERQMVPATEVGSVVGLVDTSGTDTALVMETASGR